MNTPEQSLQVYKENRIKNDIRSIVDGLDAASSIYKKWKKEKKPDEPEKISAWMQHPPSDEEDPRFSDVMEEAKNSPIFQPSLPIPWAIIDSNHLRPLTVFSTLENVKKNKLLIKGAGSTYIHNPLRKLTEIENRVKENLLGDNFTKILVTDFTLGEDVLRFYDATLIKQYQVIWMYEAPLEGDCIIGGKREVLYRVMMLE